MKDPAILFYYTDWLTSTAEMDADCRGWYLNLIIHNYDKGSIPNDVEKCAVLAGVKFSEFQRFEQVFQQVLQHLFQQTDQQRLSNPRAKEILRRREAFKEKRSNAGKLSRILTYFRSTYKSEMTKGFEAFIKANTDEINLPEIDVKNEQVLQHLLQHLLQLYRNRNEIIKEDSKVTIKGAGNKKPSSRKTSSVKAPPTVEEVVSYFKDNGFNEELAKRFHAYYQSANWYDQRGNKVNSWKQKAISNWFKNNQPHGNTNSPAGTKPTSLEEYQSKTYSTDV